MKSSYQDVILLMERIIDSANRHNNNFLDKDGYGHRIEVTSSLIRVCFYSRGFLEQDIMDFNRLKMYVNILEETIPIYSKYLKIIDYYVGEFYGFDYDPITKVHYQRYTISKGAGIVEIKVNEELEIS